MRAGRRAVRDDHRPPAGARGGAGRGWPSGRRGWRSAAGSRSPASCRARPAAPGVPHVAGVRTADGETDHRPTWSSTAGAAARGWRTGCARSAPGRRSRSARTPASSTTAGTSGRADGSPPPGDGAAAPALRAVHPLTLPARQRDLVGGTDHQLGRPPAAGAARRRGLARGARAVPAGRALGGTDTRSPSRSPEST